VPQQPDLGRTQDLGKTQPDFGTTFAGGRPEKVYAPVRGGTPNPRSNASTLVGLGGIFGNF
jgi:hypothetical protein